ncbi:hypothetical protein DAPPUDRAFT_115443 [Daphnia pulex]|uniref:Uncharacterized protein n=1 Tax=Daphnia pulex TaxID=6669 RepID=E9HLC6_DAPPU|nr:hypothetical protein DAPPUDRAFT_115443 [Daphnia pulex]|eukprot:EFX67454.1 hypothetical protein DAPPUDRAFT_115443 [Daphnia pulex]
MSEEENETIDTIEEEMDIIEVDQELETTADEPLEELTKDPFIAKLASFPENPMDIATRQSASTINHDDASLAILQPKPRNKKKSSSVRNYEDRSIRKKAQNYFNVMEKGQFFTLKYARVEKVVITDQIYPLIHEIIQAEKTQVPKRFGDFVLDSEGRGLDGRRGRGGRGGSEDAAGRASGQSEHAAAHVSVRGRGGRGGLGRASGQSEHAVTSAMVHPTNLGTADIVLFGLPSPLDGIPNTVARMASAESEYRSSRGSIPDVIEEHSLVPTPDMDGLLPSGQTSINGRAKTDSYSAALGEDEENYSLSINNEVSSVEDNESCKCEERRRRRGGRRK